MVGFVEHRDLDGIEIGGARLDVVAQSAGTGDDDVESTPKRAYLWFVSDPTKDRSGLQAEHRCERCHRFVDLGDQLACRGEDECTWTIR